MKKNLIIISYLVCWIGFFFVFSGCDQPADKAATPKVVRKKIYAKTEKKAKPPKAKSVAKPQPTPKAKPATKQAPEQPLLAKKSEPPAAQRSKAATPTPPVKPKSDISITRAPSQKQGEKTAPSRTTTPSTASTTIADKSSKGMPVYNPKGKIDPFEPLFREQPTVAKAKAKPKKREPRTPLEKIDISQLKLVGIIVAESGNNKALVEESNGKGYVIKKGTYIGTNSGKVVKIEKDKVIVAEEWEDVLGNVTLRNKELKLPKPPGNL